MKPIARDEVLGLAEYERIRERFRARVIAEKKTRRAALGSRLSMVFENRDTALLQIQEMLRTERITRGEAVQHEIDTYNDLVPGDGELSATLMVEIPDKEERDAFLVAAAGLEKHVWLVAGTQRVGPVAAPRDGAVEGRTTAVHYLKFSLPPALALALRGLARGEKTPVHLEIVVDHPACEARVALPPETILALGQDLAD